MLLLSSNLPRCSDLRYFSFNFFIRLQNSRLFILWCYFKDYNAFCMSLTHSIIANRQKETARVTKLSFTGC